MRSLLYLALLVSCFALAAGLPVFGQGAARAALGASELNNLVAFYEWALEARISQGQRQELREVLEQELRDEPAKARGSIDTLLGAWSQIKQSGEEKRRQTRAEFLSGYLPELRKSADEKHALLMNIYKAAHGGRDTYTDLDAALGNAADKSDLHAASGDGPLESLIGRWERHTGSGSIGDGTGKTKYGNGTTFAFEFGPGGAVAYSVAEKTLSIMGCKIESTYDAKGKFALNGSEMTMTLGAGTKVGTDSCDRSGNYRKAQPAANISVAFQINQSDDITRPDCPMLLCMNAGDGEACFEKVLQ